MMTFSMFAMIRFAVPATSIGGMGNSVSRARLAVKIRDHSGKTLTDRDDSGFSGFARNGFSPLARLDWCFAVDRGVESR